jgi:acetolactate synthase I/II/III large subunit
MSAPITGAEIVVRCLAEEGVEHVFGYPGGAVLYIYDAIFNQDKFQHILVRHEQAAVMPIRAARKRSAWRWSLPAPASPMR